MTEQIPQDLLAETIAFLADCDDAGALRERLAAFVEAPVDPIASILADAIAPFAADLAKYVRQGHQYCWLPESLAVLRKAMDAAKPVPVDDAVLLVEAREICDEMEALPRTIRIDNHRSAFALDNSLRLRVLSALRGMELTRAETVVPVDDAALRKALHGVGIGLTDPAIDVAISCLDRAGYIITRATGAA